MSGILRCGYCDASYFYHFGESPYKWKHEDRITLRPRHNYYHRFIAPCKNKSKTLLMEVLDVIGLILYRRAMTESSVELSPR